MLQFEWNKHSFNLLELGKGVFKEDMVGHSHAKNSYEFHYITDGEGTLTTDTNIYKLQKGDFFITGPNVYHQQSTNPKNPLTEIYIYIQASEKKTNDALVGTFLATHFYFKDDCDLLYIFENCFKELEQKKWGYKSALSGLMQLLVIEVTRLYCDNFVDIEEPNDNLNDRRFILIEQAFINEPEGITLGKLSNMIGLCERQTQRLLQKYYGKSFKEKKAESVKNNVHPTI